ncbi:protein kinase [Streptomyces sp. NPDC058220]|uniref:serine/threonine-protein kinase n=1 Tax=Streptomyces sp. NPDC058220 TaxID=3346387 RepID=UPI0036E577D3
MGEVWRAVDEVLGRPVAVKMLLNPRADDAAVARFHLEARTAARLSHPHVVAVYDTGTDRDRLYLVTELVDGRSLADELSGQAPWSPRRVATIGAQAAAGLAAAHRQGVVHRDVKPGNLLLDRDDTVKVSDFGIARFMDEPADGPTKAGEIIGTSSYLAPERALERPAGPAADMYALGCVLYELLAGRPPFRADSAAAMLYQHVDSPPEPPRRYRHDLPEALDAFVLRLLAKDPEERPTAQHASDFLAAPDGWETRPSPRVASRLRTTTATAATTRHGFRPPAPAREGSPEQQSHPAAPRSRRPRLVLGAVVTAIAAASVSLYAASPSSDADHPGTTQPSSAHEKRGSTRAPTSAPAAVATPAGVPLSHRPSAAASGAATTAPSDQKPGNNSAAPTKPTSPQKSTPVHTPTPTPTPTPTESPAPTDDPSPSEEPPLTPPPSPDEQTTG